MKLLTRLLFLFHGKREERDQSFLILKDFYDQLCLGNICCVFQTLLSDICLNGNPFVFFVRVSQGQSDALQLILLRYLTKLKLILFAKTKRRALDEIKDGVLLSHKNITFLSTHFLSFRIKTQPNK